MVKNINIHATYNNQSHIFECSQHEFLEKAAEYFNIDIRDTKLYSVKKGQRPKQITPHDITSVMRIEIVHKNDTARMGNQRTLRSYLDNESPNDKSINNIITKLTNNTPLSGQERKSLVEWLQIYSTTITNKRKYDDISQKPDVAHKKVQIDLLSTNRKDSFTQTDLVNTLSEEVHSHQDEQISNRIKKLAGNSDKNRDEVAKLMRDSFDDRRNFIFLKAPPVTAVRDKYPSLFCLEEVKNELGRIFYAEKCDEFIKNMHMYAPFILQKCNPTDDVYLKTEKATKRAYSEVQKQYAQVVGSIFALCKLMGENWGFIHLQDYPHGSHDVYPHIDTSNNLLKEMFFDNFIFSIVVEEQLLCEANNLLEAILCLIGTFFIFNIDYPESCRRTLIVFEKLYLEANDTKDLDDLTMQMVKLLKLQAKSEHV